MLFLYSNTNNEMFCNISKILNELVKVSCCFKIVTLLSDGLNHVISRDISVIFTRKLTFDLGYQQETRPPQNQSYNFNLLSMPRVKRSYHGLKQTLDRGKIK